MSTAIPSKAVRGLAVMSLTQSSLTNQFDLRLTPSNFQDAIHASRNVTVSDPNTSLSGPSTTSRTTRLILVESLSLNILFGGPAI